MSMQPREGGGLARVLEAALLLLARKPKVLSSFQREKAALMFDSRNPPRAFRSAGNLQLVSALIWAYCFSLWLTLSLSVCLSVRLSPNQSILGGELGLGSPGAASPTKPAGQYYQHYNQRRRTLPMDTMGETTHTHTHTRAMTFIRAVASLTVTSHLHFSLLSFYLYL